MHVYITSHTYIEPINRANLETAAQHMALKCIITNRWRDALFDLELQARSRFAIESIIYTNHLQERVGLIVEFFEQVLTR